MKTPTEDLTVVTLAIGDAYKLIMEMMLEVALSEISFVSHMFLSPKIAGDLLKNALSTFGSFWNKSFQNWFLRALAAVAIAAGSTEASLRRGVRFGIFKACPNLD